jgi:hypothetical protein
MKFFSMITFATLALTANAQFCSSIYQTCVDFNVQLPFCRKLRLACRKMVVAGLVSRTYNATIPNFHTSQYPNIACRTPFSLCFHADREKCAGLKPWNVHWDCVEKNRPKCSEFSSICQKVFRAKFEGILNTDPPKPL